MVGSSCAGKTTLARALCGALGTPHTELDVLHWGPGWTPRPPEEFRSRVEAAVAAPAWVIDGNYSAVRDLVWGRATTLVWLDYPLWLVFPRALARTFRRIATREELFAGNHESLRGIVDPDWIPWWVLRTFRHRRRAYPQLFQKREFAHLQVLRLEHPREGEAFLRECGAEPAA